MEQNMDKEMEQQMDKIIYTLKERIPNSDNMVQETHENKDSVHVENPSINKTIPRGFNYNIGDNHGWFPKGVYIARIDMKKFEGNDLIIWIFQMERFLDLHQVPTLEDITITSLYLEPG